MLAWNGLNGTMIFGAATTLCCQSTDGWVSTTTADLNFSKTLNLIDLENKASFILQGIHWDTAASILVMDKSTLRQSSLSWSDADVYFFTRLSFTPKPLM